MTPACRRAGTLLLRGAFLVVMTALSAAGQAAPAQSTQERLKRVSTDLLSRADRIPDAVKELKDILATDPTSADAHMLLGIAYRNLGGSELLGEAVAELRQAIALNPRLAPARLYLAYVYLDLGRPARARQELQEALTAAPGQPAFLAAMGETERQMKNPTRAIELLRQALAADPSFAQGRYYLGLALLDAGQRDDGIKALEQIVASGAKVAEVHMSLGAAYIEAGRIDEALETLSQGSWIDPSRPDIRVALARAYRIKGALDKAEEQLKVATPQPTLTASSQQLEFDYYTELGLLRLARKQLSAAAEAFQRVLDMDPSHGQTHRYLAEVCLEQGAIAKAREHAAIAEKQGAPLPEHLRKRLQQKSPAAAGPRK
ncbi:MAG TPA: tetratricopeptide repeat protein [Vicinamibacterales bacterium]|nr:tetratricopeptide repeat protein [Vicinamibacterales bacterium]